MYIGLSTQAEGVQHRGYIAMQMSPAALEHRHAVELHLLDSMEVSMRQLTDVDRMRVITLAQQETVSLAQILKVAGRYILRRGLSHRYLLRHVLFPSSSYSHFYVVDVR